MINFPEKLPESVDKAIENVSGPITEEAGRTFGDLWFLIFGDFTKAAAKKRIRMLHDIEQFRKQIAAKVDAIPIERRVDAKLQVAGYALEKAKYCIEEPELREMFARLISKSVDREFASKTHPSFADIILQITPFEAEVFRLFRCKEFTLPIVTINAKVFPAGYTTCYSHLFAEIPAMTDFTQRSSAICALERNGLISTDYTRIAIECAYDKFRDTEIYQLIESIDLKDEADCISPNDDGVVIEYEYIKGIAQLTPLGVRFAEICCWEDCQDIQMP